MAEVGEELVEFGLDHFLGAGEKNAQEGRQNENAAAGEIFGI